MNGDERRRLSVAPRFARLIRVVDHNRKRPVDHVLLVIVIHHTNPDAGRRPASDRAAINSFRSSSYLRSSVVNLLRYLRHLPGRAVLAPRLTLTRTRSMLELFIATG